MHQQTKGAASRIHEAVPGRSGSDVASWDHEQGTAAARGRPGRPADPRADANDPDMQVITRHLAGFPDLPPVWFAGAWLLSEVLARTAPLLRIDREWLDVVAVVAALTGVGLAAWSALWFRAKRTRVEPRQVPHALIVEGPYRFSRNPIYLGLVLILTGLALRPGALSALLPAVLLAVVLQRRFVISEEAELRRAFGADAVAFIERTPRWIGRSRRSRGRDQEFRGQ